MTRDSLRERFDRFDRDGNGKIDQSELDRLLDALGMGFSKSQVLATFESIDENRSGLIDFEEFRSWWQSR